MKKIKKTKPNKKIASALKYNAAVDDVPYVVATGQGNVAEKMIEKGLQHGVKVVEDKPLAALLQNVSVGDEIPEELYQVVAQVLVFISELDSEFAQKVTPVR